MVFGKNYFDMSKVWKGGQAIRKLGSSGSVHLDHILQLTNNAGDVGSHCVCIKYTRGEVMVLHVKAVMSATGSKMVLSIFDNVCT